MRVKEGLEIVDLARLAGLSERTVSGIERGKGSPKDVTLHRILNALNDNPKRRRKEEYTFEEIFPTNQPGLF